MIISLGTVAVVYIIIFVIVKASLWGINMDFSNHFKIPGNTLALIYVYGFPVVHSIGHSVRAWIHSVSRCEPSNWGTY